MRIIKEIEIEGKKAVALFDTGALASYVRKEFVEDAFKRALPYSYKVGLGGRMIEVKEEALLFGRIEGLPFTMTAIPLDEVGEADGKRLDVIIGALTMERWEIIPNPNDGTLDLTGLRRGEFTEFPDFFIGVETPYADRKRN